MSSLSASTRLPCATCGAGILVVETTNSDRPGFAAYEFAGMIAGQFGRAGGGARLVVFCSLKCKAAFLYSKEPLPGTCASCVHWRTYAAVVDTGWCERLTAIGKDSHACIVVEGSPNVPTVRTPPDFGCSLWRPKETTS